MPEIDLSLYVRAPVVDMAGAVALGVSLLSAMPKGAPPPVQSAAKKLRGSVIALQSAWGASTAPAPAVNKRAADLAMDVAWGCLEARLGAYARLPAAHHPKSARAAEIHEALFAEGLDFLTLPFKSQWAEGQKRLDLIKEKGYAADVEALAGQEFLAEVKRAHKVYGEALGITKAEEAVPDVELAEPRREVGRSIVDYALQLLAYMSDVPKAEGAVRKALKPIDDQRAAAARRAADGGGALRIGCGGIACAGWPALRPICRAC